MKKNLKLLIQIILISIFFTIGNVYATEFTITEVSEIEGNSGYDAACNSDSTFCFGGSGIRFSLYYFDNNSEMPFIEKIGSSYDLWSEKHESSWLSPYPANSGKWKNAHYSSLANSNDTINLRISRGTTWYSNGTSFGGNCSGTCRKLDENKKASFDNNFSNYVKSGTVVVTDSFNSYCDGKTESTELVTKIKEYLNEKITNIDSLSTFFKINIDSSNINNYYITWEPTLAILTNGGVNGKKGHVYVGTVGELSQIYTYRSYANAVRSISDSEEGFIGKLLLKAPSAMKPENDAGTSINGWRVLNQYAYGIGVYKLNTFITGCTCNGDYKCTLDYCDKSSDREACAKSCGVEEVNFSTCGSDENINPNDSTTSCDNENSATLTSKMCEPSNGATYYKTNCTETNILNYDIINENNTNEGRLPITIRKKEGFSYKLKLSGERSCTLTFDSAKWNYDYLISSDEGRSNLVKKVETYNSFTKDNLSDLSYKNDESVTIKVDEDKEALTMVKKTNDTSTENFSNSKNTTTLLDDGKINNSKTYKTESKNTEYQLPYKCLYGGRGDVYDAEYIDSSYSCNWDGIGRKDDGPFNKYFTNSGTKEDRYNTLITFNKRDLSETTVTHACYYDVKESTTDDVPKTKEENCPIDSNAVKSYCKDKYEDNNNSYKRCIQTCLCGTETDWTDNKQVNEKCRINDDSDMCRLCPNVKRSNEIVYRPISLTDPFPNREPGANWRGYVKSAITDKKIDYDNPEYVVRLTPQDIQNINNDTKKKQEDGKNAYIDYIWNNENESGVYESKFIHTTFKDLFIKTPSSGGGS